ncbi:MAG TPA: ATP-binding protein [Candidatus Binatia bacterium]|jgi:signal transduction histidine kinase
MDHHPWKKWLLLVITGLFTVLLMGESFLSTGHWINQPFPGFFVHENLTVAPYFMPSWTGPRSGLQSLDRLLTVEDRPIKNRAELYEVARRVPVSTPIHYQITRGGRSLSYTIPTMNFTLRDWFMSFGVYVFIGLAFLVIGVTPYLFRASSPVAFPLCFMVLTVFVWFQSTFDFVTESILPKELRIFALSLTPSAGIHLALLLSSGSTGASLRPLQIAFIYGISLMLGALNSITFFGPLDTWMHNFRAGYLYICIGALSFLAITGNALRRTDSELDRLRLRVMFVGALLGFLIPGAATVLTSSYQFQIPYNLALVPTIFFPVSVAYALLKYSLFDLGNALRLALSRFALLTLLVAIYAVMALLIAPWIGDYAKDPLVPLFFSILVVILFNPLLRWLEGIIDRYIFRQDYDPATVQKEISLYLRNLDSAASLAKGFIERTTRFLQIEGAIVVYRHKQAPADLAVVTGSALSIPEHLIANSQGLREIWPADDYRAVARAEVINHPSYKESRDVVMGVFSRWQAELLMPLVYEREVRGAVAFGVRRSGREYSAEDYRLLETLVQQLALSLENGRLYEESLQAYRRVEATNQKLIEMDRKKKDFVANICHELRTPISTIIGFAEVLREPNSKADTRDVLNRLVNNGQELSDLMDNLMNFSRMETDAASAQFELVKLGEILAALEMMTQRLIRERPIEFGIHIEAPVETIESDGQKLQQILVQLLTNALKFTKRGKIELAIRTRTQQAHEYLEIAVADTGIGIRQEDQKIIFEDFQQLDGSSTRQYGGTGLGLGLCRKLAAALGGEIRVASEIGVGSVFSLLLPITPPASGAQTVLETQPGLLQ